MVNYKEKNIQILTEFHPHIARKIKNYKNNGLGDIVYNTYDNANLSLKDGLYLHNFQNPWQEADEHLTMLPDDFSGIALFCGFGFGYWPLRMLEKGYKPSLTIIIEPSIDLFVTAITAMDLTDLLRTDNILLFIGEINWPDFEKTITKIAIFETTCFFRLTSCSQWRQKLYKEADEQAFAIMNSLNIQGATLREIGPVFFKNTLKNLTLLRHCPPLDCLQGAFRNKPAIIISAGPSLDNDLENLRQIVGKCVLIAVDSVVKPLLEAGIIPDIITSIDFQELNFEKLAPLLDQKNNLSLISLVKESTLVPKRLRTRHTFLAFQDDEQDTWLTRALDLRCFVSSGSSVAHLALGVANLLEASPICFLGQDLAFLESADDHAKGTLFKSSGLPEDQEILTIPGVRDSEVKTHRCFLEFLNQFANIIRTHPTHYINLTSRGARIPGTDEMSIDDARQSFFSHDLHIAATIDQAVAKSTPYAVGNFMNKCKLMLDNIKHLQRNISEIEKLSGYGIKSINKQQKKGRQLKTISDLPPGSQKSIAQIDRLSNKLDNEDELWQYLQTLSLDMFHENQKTLAANQEILNKGDYAAWLSAELLRIKNVNLKRKEILTDFKLLLAALYNHLKEEKELQEEDFTNKLSAASLYLDSEDIIQAENALSKFDYKNSSSKDLGQYHKIKGSIMANLLNFEQANKEWNQAQIFDTNIRATIIRQKQELCKIWLKLACKYEVPIMIDKWMTRIMLLCQDMTIMEIKLIYTDLDILPSILAIFARRLIEDSHFEAGIAVLKDAVAKDPKTADLWDEIGDLLANGHDLFGAMQAYQYCYESQPDNIIVLQKFRDAAARCNTQDPIL